MCLDCGCGKPNDDHGDPRHITLQRLEQAAVASDLPIHEVVQNIQEGYRLVQSQTHNTVNWEETESRRAAK